MSNWVRCCIFNLWNYRKKIYVVLAYSAFALFYKKHIRQGVIRFLNIGLDIPPNIAPHLKTEDEKERLQYQMYYYVLHRLQVDNKHVVDMGCGLGGGCYYINKYLAPKSITGIDLLGVNIAFAKQLYNTSTIRFIKGDACHYTFNKASVDIIVDIENSHGYLYFNSYVNKAYAALKPGGYLTFADIRITAELAYLHQAFIDAGFNIITQEDITGHSVTAMDIDENRKLAILNDLPFGKMLFHEFSFTKATKPYQYLAQRKWIYVHYLLQKPLK
jgi:SAM-dependent methyltransferase